VIPEADARKQKISVPKPLKLAAKGQDQVDLIVSAKEDSKVEPKKSTKEETKVEPKKVGADKATTATK